MFFKDFTTLKALQVINSDLVNNVGNLLSRSTVKKLNPDQIYPCLIPSLLKGSSLKIANPLIDSLNEIRGYLCISFLLDHKFR